MSTARISLWLAITEYPRDPRSRAPHRYALRSGELLHVCDGVFSKVKNARGQHRIRLAFEQHLSHVFGADGTADVHARNADGLADAAAGDVSLGTFLPQ